MNYRTSSSESFINSISCNIITHLGPHKCRPLSWFYMQKLYTNPKCNKIKYYIKNRNVNKIKAKKKT